MNDTFNDWSQRQYEENDCGGCGWCQDCFDTQDHIGRMEIYKEIEFDDEEE